jgi:hypothetical protein
LHPERSSPLRIFLLYLCGLRSLWPIQRHFLSFIHCSTVVFCFLPFFLILNSTLELFTIIWNELLIHLFIFHVSHPYSRTDSTKVLIEFYSYDAFIPSLFPRYPTYLNAKLLDHSAAHPTNPDSLSSGFS